jgi:hypothetical protein
MSDKPTIQEMLAHLDNEGPELNTATEIDAMTQAIRAILTEHEKVQAALRDQEIADGYSVSALQAELAQVKAERKLWMDRADELDKECAKEFAAREKAEAERDRAIDNQMAMLENFEKAEARLALAEPLLKAVAGGDVGGEEWPYEVMKQAQAYRQALEAKPKGEKGEEDGK